MSTTHTNRSILAWGASGAAKTSQIAYLARRTWRQSKKRTRLISADGGGWAPIKPEIDAGLIEPWNVPYVKGQTVAIFRKLSLGWWPVATPDGRMKLAPPTKETFEEFGLLSFEGLTAISERIFRDFQDQGVKLSSKDDLPTLINEGNDDLGGKETLFAPTQGHYNWAQREVAAMVDNANGLPFDRTYWTALESGGEEKVGRENVYGPQLVGSAKSSKAPAWFGDCIHLDTLDVPVKDAKGQPIKDSVSGEPVMRKLVRGYFMNHTDAKTGFKYLAKPRVPPHLYGELEKRFPGGYVDIPPEKGIDVFLDFEDELFGKADVEVKKLGFDLTEFRKTLAAAKATPVTATKQ